IDREIQRPVRAAPGSDGAAVVAQVEGGEREAALLPGARVVGLEEVVDESVDVQHRPARARLARRLRARGALHQGRDRGYGFPVAGKGERSRLPGFAKHVRNGGGEAGCDVVHTPHPLIPSPHTGPESARAGGRERESNLNGWTTRAGCLAGGGGALGSKGHPERLRDLAPRSCSNASANARIDGKERWNE